MRTKLAFGVGASGEAGTLWMFNALTFFFYNQVLGLPPDLAGYAVAIAIVFDAITDPVMGSISDRFRSKYGRRHPFMFAAPGPILIALFFIFNPPDTLETDFQLFAWYTFFTIILRVSLTLFTVPHLALGAELSDDYDERSKVMSYNTLFGYIGVVFMHVFVWFIIFDNFEGGQRNIEAYTPIVIYASVLIATCILVSAWFTKDQIPFLKKPPDDGERIGFIRLVKDMRGAMSNKNYLNLLIGLFFLSVLIGTHETLGLYMVTFFWELTPYQIGFLIINNIIGYALGFILAARLHRRFDKKATIVFTCLTLSIFWSSAVTLRLFDLAPLNSTWELVIFIICLGSISSASGSILHISVMSALADVADENELKTGMRQEGIYYSARAFFGKASNAFGHVVAGWALKYIGFPENAIPGELASEMIFNLGIIDGPFAMVWGFIAVLFYYRYGIDRKYHAQIQEQLRLKKSSQNSSNQPESV
jgi:Na+/melibiose symporter-like transporter